MQIVWMNADTQSHERLSSRIRRRSVPFDRSGRVDVQFSFYLFIK
jgi:hypothetical protein